jgi:hypothetical protein
VFSSLFNHFFKQKTNDGIDRSLGFARMSEFGNYLLQAQYDKFERGYDLLHWSERSLLVDGCMDEKYVAAIEKWAKMHSAAHQSHLFFGVSLTQQAWQIRTAQTADKITKSQTERFKSLLELALEHLQFADEVNSNDPETCARIVRVLMGLGAEADLIESWFVGAKALETNHLYAHLAMLNYYTPKWHGNGGRMYGFANTHYMTCDKGILSVLPLYAMVEEWLYLGMNNEEAAQRDFFKEGYRRTYILQIQAKFIEFSDTTLLHPIFYNYLAFLLLRIGEPEFVRAIAPSFVHGKMTEFPWAYIGVNNHTELRKVLRL